MLRRRADQLRQGYVKERIKTYPSKCHLSDVFWIPEKGTIQAFINEHYEHKQKIHLNNGKCRISLNPHLSQNRDTLTLPPDLFKKNIEINPKRMCCYCTKQYHNEHPDQEG